MNSYGIVNIAGATMHHTPSKCSSLLILSHVTTKSKPHTKIVEFSAAELA